MSQVPSPSLDDLSVNEIIRLHPATVAVFNRFGIDACCGGAATLAVAAERDGADPGAVRAAVLQTVGAAQ
jgi:regulator of cell morphogenesis and NO signaling